MTTAVMQQADEHEHQDRDQDAKRWRAVIDRDATAGGFFYGVVTTGIYCLPGCPSPAPRRENVVFFDGISAARGAGLRPCRRCRPDSAGVPSWLLEACRALARPGARVEAVAASAGISRSTLHRTCVEVLGVTPSGFRNAASGARLRAALDTEASLLHACFDAGFASTSGAYARSRAALGVTPGLLRRKGKDMNISFATGVSSLGEMVAAASGDGICLLEFLAPGQTPEEAVHARFPRAAVAVADASTASLLASAIAAVDAPEQMATLPLDVQGTAFQLRVWAALKTLTSGERLSYSQLAERIGQPTATRAVARAVAQNPLAVLVPCHRVVGKDGALTGYRWGVDRKRRLLAREAEEERET